MPKEFSRSERLADVIQREVMSLILREMNDPRVKLVTVTAVKVSHDLSHAKIYVTFLQAPENPKAVVEVLNRAVPFFRYHLGKALKVRIVPDIVFIQDEALDRARHLTDLIHQAAKRDEQDIQDTHDDESSQEK